MAPSKTTKPLDPWGQVDDLDGTGHYRTLGVETKATAADIKKAFRALAKQHHPDKGGDPTVFGRIQHAYEVLSDPKKRTVYDTWAKELQYRYVRTATSGQALGGEDILLDEFENLGLKCNPATQLVVTCEVCRRPATKECWTCGMRVCEFCTLKQHWKGSFALHWPLINADHMRERLAKRELEKKRLEDAQRLALEDPNHRAEGELQEIRRFKEAAYAMLKREDRQVQYDLELARYYMWAQTDATVFVACRVFTGYEDRELVMECSQQGLLIQSEDSPPLIDRALAYSLDTTRQIELFRTQDNRFCVVAIPKAELGERWQRLFRGDSDGARCMEPPYTITETEEDLVLEVVLPFWIDSGDVRVQVTSHELKVEIRNTLSLRRTFWRNSEEESRNKDYRPIISEECVWGLDDEETGGPRGNEPCKVLMITLAKPPPTEDETTWKKGKRQNHLVKERPGSMHQKGWRFFSDDEDEFGLEDLIQALCYLESGKTFVPPKPWQHGEEAKWVTSATLLPPTVRAFVDKFREQQQEEGGGGGGQGGK